MRSVFVALVLCLPVLAQQPLYDIMGKVSSAWVHVEVRPSFVKNNGGKLALAELVKNSQVEAFLRPLWSRASSGLAQGRQFVEQLLQVESDWTASLLEAGWAASILGIHGDGPVVVDAVLAVTSDPARASEMQSVLARLEAILYDSGMSFTDRSVGPHRLRGAPYGRSEDAVLLYGTIDATFFVFSSTTAAERVLAAAPERPVSQDPGFVRVRDQLDPNNSLVWVGVSFPAIFEDLPQSVPQEVLDFTNLWQFNTLDWTGYSLELDPPGIRDRFCSSLAPDSPYRVPPHGRTGEHGLVSFVPEGTSVAFFAAMDCKASWQLLQDTFDQAKPQGGAIMRDFTLRMESSLGIDFARDVLGSLGPEWGAYMAFPGASLIPDLGVCFEVQPGAREKLERILESAERTFSDIARVRRMDFRGYQIRWLEFLGGDPRWANSPLRSARPSFAFVGPYLVVTPWPQALKNLVAGLDAQAPRLRDRADYKMLRARVRPSGEISSIAYVDLQAGLRFLLDHGIPTIQMVSPSWGAGWPDLRGIPTTPVLADSLFGSLTITSNAADGSSCSECYSPVGLMPVIMLLAGLTPMVADVGAPAPAEGAARSIYPTAQRLVDAVQEYRAWEGHLLAEADFPHALVKGSPAHPEPYLDVPLADLERRARYRVLPDGGFEISWWELGVSDEVSPSVTIGRR